MGLYQIFKENNAVIGIWELTENLEELQFMLPEYDTAKIKSDKRKKELLCSRILLTKLHPNSEISYNKFKAPQLSDSKHISICHSKKFVSIIISEKKVGIDIEEISEKSLRISSKFTNKKNLTKEKSTLIWCAKESIFKLHQKRGIDFRNDILIDEFRTKNNGELLCNFKGEKIIVKYRKIDNQYLAYVCN